MIAKTFAWLNIRIVGLGMGLAEVLAGRALASCFAQPRPVAAITWDTVNWNG